MTPLDRIIAKASRRRLLARAMHHAGWGLTIGLLVAAAVLLVDRVAGFGIPTLFYIVPPLTGVIAGVVRAWITRSRRWEVAADLDQTLHLKDRLGSAHVMRHSATQDAQFIELLNRDANRLADRLDVRSATPIRITPIWSGAAPLALLLTAGVLYLPNFAWAARDPQTQPLDAQRRTALLEEQRRLVEQVDEIVNEVDEEFLDSEAARAELDALQRLADQLAANEPLTNEAEQSVSRARDESAAAADRLAEQLAATAEQQQQAAQRVAEKFRAMPTPPDAPLTSREFEEAMKRGDFEQAAAEFERLMEEAGQMNETQRRQVAERLRQLGDQLDQQPPADPSLREDRAMLEQALRDQRLTPQQIDEVLNQPPSETSNTVEQLEQKGVEEELAEKLADQLEQMRREQQVEQQAQQDTEQIVEQLQRSAEELEQPQNAQQQPGPEAKPDSPPRQRTPADRTKQQPQDSNKQNPRDTDDTRNTTKQKASSSDQQEAQREPAASQEPAQPQQQQQSQPQAQPTDKQQQSSQQGSEQQPTPQPDSSGEQQQQQQQSQSQQQQPQQQRQQLKGEQGQGQPDQQQPGATPSEQSRSAEQTPQQSSDQQQQQQNQQGERRPDPTSPMQENMPQSQQQPSPSPTADQQRTAQDRPQPGQQGQQSPQQQQQPSPGEQPQGQEQQQEAPGNALRRLAERMQSAEQQQQAAERLRRRAREMADNMSDEEKQRWAQQWQQMRDDQAAPSEGSEDSGGSGGSLEPGTTPGEMAQTTPPDPSQFTSSDPIDLRSEDIGDQVLADWLNPNQPAQQPGVTPANTTPRISQARDIAERAVEDAAVPSRYHPYIKRFFNRLPETIDEAAGQDKTSQSDADQGKAGQAKEDS